jgi:hypothetical protein
MTLKENLVEELQKLRASRERPKVKQVKSKPKQDKVSKSLDLAKRLLEDEDDS